MVDFAPLVTRPGQAQRQCVAKLSVFHYCRHDYCTAFSSTATTQTTRRKWWMKLSAAQYPNVRTICLRSSSSHLQTLEPTDSHCSAIIAPMQWRYRPNEDGNLQSFPSVPISRGCTSGSFRGRRDLPKATPPADHPKGSKWDSLSFTCFGVVCHRCFALWRVMDFAQG